MRTFLGLLLFLPLLYSAAYADQARDNRAVAILTQALSSTETNQDLVKAVVTALRTELKMCPTPHAQGSISATDCIHYELRRMIDRAADDEHRALDRVEKTVLQRVFSLVVINGGDLKIDLTLDSAPRGKGISQPNVFDYRTRKTQFAALRRAKGQTEALDPAVSKAVEKAYQRKMKGVGRVGAGQIGPEEYMAARFTRLQINSLAQLLTQLIERMNHSSGRVVLDQPDFAPRSIRVETLELEVMDLVSQLGAAGPADAPAIRAQLAQKRSDLKAERDGMKADQLFVEIQLKKNERAQAIESLLEEGIDPTERAARAARVEDIDAVIQRKALELADQRKEITLPPSDVDKLVVKALKIELTRITTQRGPFQGSDLEIGDIVMAGWISGEIDTDLLKAVLEMDALGEPHESAIGKIATQAWRVGSTLAMAYPATAYGVTIASIIISSLEQAKDRAKKEADDASLVR